MIVNDPTVVAEVEKQFQGYERALMANDVDALNDYFWRDPRTLRFGPAENLYGHDAIAAYRAARDPEDIRRELLNTVVTTFGSDHAVANTEYVRVKSGRRGRQSQTWVRMPEGWRIVSAHVSLMAE